MVGAGEADAKDAPADRRHRSSFEMNEHRSEYDADLPMFPSIDYRADGTGAPPDGAQERDACIGGCDVLGRDAPELTTFDAAAKIIRGPALARLATDPLLHVADVVPVA